MGSGQYSIWFQSGFFFGDLLNNELWVMSYELRVMSYELRVMSYIS